MAKPNVKELMDSFRRIVHSLRSSHRAAGDINLSGAQLFVLATLGSANEAMGVKELAEQTGTDQSTVSVVVGRLVDRGLVKRVRSSRDTRRVELSLTAPGRALQRKAPAIPAQIQLAGALGQLPPDDARALTRILGKIVSMMGEADSPAPMLFDESVARDSPRQQLRPESPAKPQSTRPAKKARTRARHK